MANTSIVDGFKVLIIVMAFYSLCITVVTYAIPTAAQHQILPYSELSNDMDIENVNSEIQDTLTRQTDMSVLEVGALVFYSGNILVDLLLNFVYAVPQMLGLIVHGITTLLNLDTYLFAYVEGFAFVVMTALYIIGIIQLLTGVRSGRII